MTVTIAVQGQMHRILVVDDDRVQVDVVSMLLRSAGFEPIAAFDAATARRLFDEQTPELVILDIHLDGVDGRDLLKQFREQRPEVLILMLTALSAEDDRVHSLELGADDYLSKPFSPRELIARVRALHRRGSVESREVVLPQRLQAGSVVLDPMTHEVTRAGRHVDLTPTEFRLLQTLMERPDTLVPTRTLLKDVWGHQDLSARNVLRVTASRLRAKLEEDPVNPRLVLTVAGEGLIFHADQPPLAVSPPSPTDAPVALDVIADLQKLLDQSGAQPLQQLNELYSNTAGRQILAMRMAVANRDAAGLVEQAHRLRGSSAGLGAQRVARVCSMIEERSRRGDLAGMEELLEQLNQELLDFEAAIDLMLGLGPR